MSGLVLTRRIGEVVWIGKNIKITITGRRDNHIRLRIEAPDEISIDREELRKKKDQDPGFNPGEVK